MKLLIFDIDGTLTDTNEVDTDCYINAFQDEFGVGIGELDWSVFKNVTDLGLFAELFFNAFQRKSKLIELNNFQTRFFNNLEIKLKEEPEKFKEIAGARDFIDFCLTKNDLKIAFATGGWSKSAKLKLQAANISFQNIVLSSSDFFTSRHEILRDAIEVALRQNESKKISEMIYFGDGVWDFQTTAELNLKFIGVDSKSDGKLSKLGVKKITEDFSNIDAVFKLLN